MRFSAYKRAKAGEAPVTEHTNFLEAASTSANSSAHPPSMLDDLLRISAEKDDIISLLMTDAVVNKDEDARLREGIGNLEDEVSKLKGELAEAQGRQQKCPDSMAKEKRESLASMDADVDAKKEKYRREFHESLRSIRDRTQEIEDAWTESRLKKEKNTKNFLNKDVTRLWSDQGVHWGDTDESEFLGRNSEAHPDGGDDGNLNGPPPARDAPKGLGNIFSKHFRKSR